MNTSITTTLGVMKRIAVLMVALCLNPAFGSPCSGVDRELTNSMKAAFAPDIEKHLNKQQGPLVNQTIYIKPEDILQVFRIGKWHVIYVNNHVSDEPFLFYNSTPQKSAAYLFAWSGAARMDEGPEIEKWVKAQAPSIPRKLAACFAWHVTRARDQ